MDKTYKDYGVPDKIHEEYTSKGYDFCYMNCSPPGYLLVNDDGYIEHEVRINNIPEFDYKVNKI